MGRRKEESIQSVYRKLKLRLFLTTASWGAKSASVQTSSLILASTVPTMSSCSYWRGASWAKPPALNHLSRVLSIAIDVRLPIQVFPWKFKQTAPFQSSHERHDGIWLSVNLNQLLIWSRQIFLPKIWLAVWIFWETIIQCAKTLDKISK